MMTADKKNDWRTTLFGPSIRTTGDEEAGGKPNLIPVEEALDDKKYDFIAVFIGADYCPHCKEFAPDVVKSAIGLETKRKCKVIFVSGDRDEEHFEASCKKVHGLDVMPFDIEKTKRMRDLFSIKTIPALLILRNSNFESPEPVLVTNARHMLVRDPTLEHVQWNETAVEKHLHPVTTLTMEERLLKKGYGKWWHFGHTGINPEYPDKMYMDEHCVRMRAGLLNIISWIALNNITGARKSIFAYVLAPIVIWEFLSTILFGLGPLSPISLMANFMTHYFQPKPHWKPARPKQFAWTLGLCLAVLCVGTFLGKDELNEYAGKNVSYPIIFFAVSFCCLATWLESVAGFCIGCAIYNTWLVKLFDVEECTECKL